MNIPSFAHRPISQTELLRIAQFCARALGVKWKDILATKRNHAGVVWARQAAQFVCHQCTEASYEQIGAVFKRHHSGVIYNVRKVAGCLDVYPELRPEMEALIAKAKRLVSHPQPLAIHKAA